ncbi:MAG: substrate-binding domain-containing protein [Armatimonadota bacterium]|nr:substrate-binding domain-containing protein [bacterium]
MSKTLPDKIASSIYTDYIESGLIKCGGRLPTIRELQRQYGRSNSIIVHALGLLDSRGVIEKKSDGICYVASEAKLTEKRMPKMIGSVVPAMTEPNFVMRIHTGVEEACREFGYQVISASANLSYEIEEQQVMRLIDVGCEAVIVTPVIRTRKQIKHDYLKSIPSTYPMVLVDVAYPEQKHTQVILDNFNAGYDMTKLLLNEGHRKIAFMESNSSDGNLMHRSNWERCDGYLRALRSAGIVPCPEDRWLIKAWYTQDEDLMNNELIALLRRWKEMPDRPTAIIALEDFYAMQIITLGRELGISVPDDLKVVGFDNLDLANRLGATFPTTNPDMALAGKIAVSLAVQQLEGRIADPTTYVLPVPIRVRTSALDD